VDMATEEIFWEMLGNLVVVVVSGIKIFQFFPSPLSYFPSLLGPRKSGQKFLRGEEEEFFLSRLWAWEGRWD